MEESSINRCIPLFKPYFLANCISFWHCTETDTVAGKTEIAFTAITSEGVVPSFHTTKSGSVFS